MDECLRESVVLWAAREKSSDEWNFGARVLWKCHFCLPLQILAGSGSDV
jgi:hypothetical protein